MSRLPRAGAVLRALKRVRAEIRAGLDQVHQRAAKQLSKGRYQDSQILVESAQQLRAFDSEVSTLTQRWRELNSRKQGTPSGTRTPLWGYYRPILRALAASDKPLATRELIASIASQLPGLLTPTDLETAANGKPRWHGMVRKAARPMAAEGFILRKKGEWRITEAGRRAATQDG